MPAVISHVFAGIRITDLRAAVAWYERLLGRPPDMLPNDSEATWALGDEPPHAPSTVRATTPRPPSHVSFRVMVADDVEPALREP